jgi:hypothetical protein
MVEDTVQLSVTVDVSEATDEQVAMYQQMAQIFGDRFETFVEKNIDYGSSFLTAGKVDQALGGQHGGPFANATEANLYKLFTRIQDKDQRFYQQVFCGGQDLVGESTAETAGDAGVYWFMVEWLLRHGDDT